MTPGGDMVASLLAIADEVEEYLPADSVARAEYSSPGFEAEITLEDAAWADSCLLLDDDGWSAFKDALLNTLGSSTETPTSPGLYWTNVENDEIVQSPPAGDEQLLSKDSEEGMGLRDEDIFRVWDLETPDEDGEEEEEEDGLIMQLKKALVDSRLRTMPRSMHSAALEEEKLDELLAAMDDLKPFSD